MDSLGYRSIVCNQIMDLLPKRILLIGSVCCLLGALSAWSLYASVQEKHIQWNPAGFLLPIGVILVLVRRTHLVPDEKPKILLVTGVLFTLSGFFAMAGNYQELSRAGATPQPGAILLPLGIGLIFGRPFCRAFLRLILFVAMGYALLTALGLLQSPSEASTNAESPPVMVFPSWHATLGVLTILGLVGVERLLYSSKSEAFFRRGVSLARQRVSGVEVEHPGGSGLGQDHGSESITEHTNRELG